MNQLAIVILAALSLYFFLEITGNLLNLKSFKNDLPSILRGVYNPERYRKSQEYVRTTTHFTLINNAFSLLLLLGFWFTGGFNWLDQIIRRWYLNSILDGLLYIGILIFVYSLAGLPFNFYRTFVIEQRFGFNKTTLSTFFSDRVKGLGLTILIGGVLISFILVIFQYFGLNAWFYCWAVVVLVFFALQYVAPLWIMPVFNNFKPLEPGELKTSILKYTSSVDFPIANIFVMDGSKRSKKSNAFFIGFGPNKRIVLFDTLIAQNTNPEILAVLAHEVGHYKKKHILQGTIGNVLEIGVMLYLLSLLIYSPDLYQAFYMEQGSIYAGLLFFALLYTPVGLVLSITRQILSRKNEYEADRFAAETIDEPEHLVAALKKLASENLSNITPHPFYVFLNYSHPPLEQRIKAILKTKLLKKFSSD